MSNDLQPLGGFGFDFPVWVQDGNPVGTGTSYGNCILIFTDTALAQGAIDDLRIAASIERVEGHRELAEFLRIAKKAGDSHAGIDLVVRQSRGIFETIDILIDKCEAQDYP